MKKGTSMATHEQEKTIRVSINLNPDSEEDKEIYEYLKREKRKGKTYTEYVKECILLHEEGTSFPLRISDMPSLVELMFKKYEEKQLEKEVQALPEFE